MPQMMPMSWITLFTFFSLILITFNVMNYYMPFNKSTLKKSIKFNTKMLVWKW
uniref:ATP synthase complex subunit 8 n=1 Tax=Amantis nawai TaxID=1453164 RepID=A0A343UMH3_9NEOP|nr:ATP synthase F0 subunit 8 [Amantis nawai]AVE15473.1 ATP synthase F0 subunit 8 [Amantis nawai]